MSDPREAIAEFFHTVAASHGHMWWSALKEADALLAALHAEGLVVVPVKDIDRILLAGANLAIRFSHRLERESDERLLDLWKEKAGVMRAHISEEPTGEVGNAAQEQSHE